MNIENAAFYYGEAAKLEDDPELYRKQGALFLQAEKYSAAVKALQKALDLDIKETGKTNMSLAKLTSTSVNLTKRIMQCLQL